jgi:mycothiol synthase
MQLQMIWPASRFSSVVVPEPPAGYRLRVGRPSDPRDEQAVSEILLASGFHDWNEKEFQNWFDRLIPDGLWLVEQVASGKPVCCTWAFHRRLRRYPCGGELGWVGILPEHKGKALSSITCAAVVRRFLQAGYRCIYLQTDEPRLPALKTYLKLGWVPNMVEPDMPGRWQAVCQNLNWPCDPDGWAREVEATKARW